MQQSWLQSIDVGRHFVCYRLFLLCQFCQVMLLKLVSYFTSRLPILPANAQSSAIWVEKEGDFLEVLRNTWKLMDSVNPDPASEGNLSLYSAEYQRALGSLMVCITSFQPFLPGLPGKVIVPCPAAGGLRLHRNAELGANTSFPSLFMEPDTVLPLCPVTSHFTPENWALEELYCCPHRLGKCEGKLGFIWKAVLFQHVCKAELATTCKVQEAHLTRKQV